MSKIKKIKRSAFKALLFLYNNLFKNCIREADAGRKAVAAMVRSVEVNQTVVVDKIHIVRIQRMNATHPVIPITRRVINLTIFIISNTIRM